MKLRVEVDGETYALDLRSSGATAQYSLAGPTSYSGNASIEEVRPGVFSVLAGTRSLTVHVSQRGEDWEAWGADGRCRIISVDDARNRSHRADRKTAAGPLEVCAQMPGKVVKILVKAGQAVEKGDGLIVVEAMKMQNEMRALKSGTVTKIATAEETRVAAGDVLLVIE